jgi:methionyl-tRNA formyltransferase
MKSNNKSDRSRPRIAFFGTPEFSATILDALIADGFAPAMVITKPDAPVGRKKVLTPSPVKILAQKHHIPVRTPRKLDEAFVHKIDPTMVRTTIPSPDLIIVAAYGKIFPKTLLALPRYGCLNVHASLLPLYRGASPIQHALLDGQTTTGITIMQMEAGLDTGPILTQRSLLIESADTTETLSPRLASLGAKLLIETIPHWIAGTLIAKSQHHKEATHCSMIAKKDGHINWRENAEMVYNRYRAFTPWPGTFSFWNDRGRSVRIRFLRMRPSDRTFGNKTPGTAIIDKKSLFIVCGDCLAIEIESAQWEGKSPASAAAIIAGYPHLHETILQ